MQSVRSEPFDASLFRGRHRRDIQIRVVAACLAAIVCSAPAHAQDPPPVFAVNGQAVLGLPDDLRDVHLDAMRAVGASTVRVDASWGTVEPSAPLDSRHSYRWDVYDSWVAALARHGLRWQPTVAYSAPWAAATPGDWRTPPADPAEYAAVAGAFATRYGHGGQFWSEHPELPYLPVALWELWNEPNSPRFWAPQPEPARYADLLAQAAGAVKAADRQAAVLFGGVLSSQRPEWFVTEALRSRPDLVALVDGVAWHPYGYDYAFVVEQTRLFRRALDRTVLAGKPLDITEFGWPSGVPGAWPEPTRARMMYRRAARLPRSDCRVRTIAVHTWLEETGERYGIATPWARLLPAGEAYARGLAWASAHRNSPVSLCRRGVAAGSSGVRRAPRRSRRASPARTGRGRSGRPIAAPRGGSPPSNRGGRSVR